MNKQARIQNNVYMLVSGSKFEIKKAYIDDAPVPFSKNKQTNKQFTS